MKFHYNRTKTFFLTFRKLITDRILSRLTVVNPNIIISINYGEVTMVINDIFEVPGTQNKKSY